MFIIFVEIEYSNSGSRTLLEVENNLGTLGSIKTVSECSLSFEHGYSGKKGTSLTTNVACTLY